jgi:short-subunit dehydrogenase
MGGRSAVVTGASAGIGRAIALRFLAEGARVCLVGRDLKTLQAAAASSAAAERAWCCRADLAVDADVRDLADAIARNSWPVDILVHCAGIMRHGRLETTAVESLDEQYRTNVRAPYLLTQKLLPELKRRKGQIVFINSSIVHHAGVGTGLYSATKHALRAIADSLREEVNADGVRVFSVFPGRTATPMQEAVFRSEGRIYRPELLLQPEDVAETVAATLALARTAEVTNIDIRPGLKSY